MIFFKKGFECLFRKKKPHASVLKILRKNFWVMFFKKINFFLQKKNLKSASYTVEKNWNLFKKDISFLMLSSQVYKNLNNYTREKECLEQILEIFDHPYYRLFLSKNAVQRGDFPSALKILHFILDESVSDEPILFEVYKIMGNIYLKCGDLDAAEENYNRANSINNEDEDLTINYGVLSMQQNNYSVAQSRFQKALNFNNKSDMGWVGMALVHRYYGEFELSRSCLLRSLDQNPYNKLALSNYYQWCEEEGIGSDKKMLQFFLKAHPQDLEAQKLFKRINK